MSNVTTFPAVEFSQDDIDCFMDRFGIVHMAEAIDKMKQIYYYEQAIREERDRRQCENCQMCTCGK